MKKTLCLIVVLLLFIPVIAHTGNDGSVFYIATNGNDDNPGSITRPFATFEKAREAVRDLLHDPSWIAEPITVYFRGGIYPISQTLTLIAEDSGSKGCPVTWCSYPGESVSFIGGSIVSGFEPLSNAEAKKRIDADYYSNIVQSDLKAQGIINYGNITRNGLGMELFFNGKVKTIARYPNNNEWLKIANVPQTGECLINEGCFHAVRHGLPVGKHYGRFAYDGDRPKRWPDISDIRMHGYWTWDWADAYMDIEKIDTIKHEVYPALPHHGYGYTKNQRYYFLNILEELDSPGEYFIDRNSGILYFWPPEPIESSVASVSILEELMVSLENTRHITIAGIIFDGSRIGAVMIKGGNNNKFAGCTFRNLGAEAVIIDGGIENGIISCDIYDVAAGGIRLSGGDRITLIPAGNYAVNNDIHNYSRVFRTNRPAINMLGVGNRIAHNRIHNAPHAGVFFSGNEHILEFNEIYRIAKETGDVGAFYIGRDWTQRGSIIRYNYFHHLVGPGFAGAQGVYLDDWSSGITIFGNIFYKSDRNILVGGGRDNLIENNIFIGGEPSVHVDARGIGWAKYYFTGQSNTLFDRMDEFNYTQPPYSEKYPELLTYYVDEPELPKNNMICRNISYGGRFLDMNEGIDLTIVNVEHNLIADPVLARKRPIEKTSTEYNPEDYQFFKYGNKIMMEKLKKRGNIVINTDPGFVDFENGNFHLKDDSPAFKLGFKRIPMEKIGLYIDEYRTELPERAFDD